MSKSLETAKFVFARNPKVEQVYICSDGRAFLSEHEALAFAPRLKDGKVEIFSRDSDTPEILDVRHGEQVIKAKAQHLGEDDQPQALSLEQMGPAELEDHLEGIDKLKDLKEIAETYQVDTAGAKSKEQYRTAIFMHFINEDDIDPADLDVKDSEQV